MLLTHPQRTALIQFIRLAFPRQTSLKISNLIGCPIALEVSGAALYPLPRLSQELSQIFRHKVFSVRKEVKGSMSGEAFLLLDYFFADQLADLLNPNVGNHLMNLNLSNCEILMEISNILLNTYAEIVGNLAGKNLNFALPAFQIAPFSTLCDSWVSNQNKVRYALVLETTFYLGDCAITSYLLLISSVAVLSCLVRGVKTAASLPEFKPPSFWHMPLEPFPA